ncbi:hypothetical protein SASPL_141554 [Salvia splendens]|uniref:Uncharacterized protein n=1 Tax=Salvia splendens TaxID=180675 RepID=A0A8X8ZCE5_SALSN|nr:hypothetical protein SASPL_141520 [Salvia splendens]KAG6400066.1 hypothetical protein SASPL_141554 [Salvia splendens]
MKLRLSLSAPTASLRPHRWPSVELRFRSLQSQPASPGCAAKAATVHQSALKLKGVLELDKGLLEIDARVVKLEEEPLEIEEHIVGAKMKLTKDSSADENAIRSF